MTFWRDISRLAVAVVSSALVWPQAAEGQVRVRLEGTAGELALTVNGKPLASSPARLILQRWQGASQTSEGLTSLTAAPKRLSPIGDAWQNPRSLSGHLSHPQQQSGTEEIEQTIVFDDELRCRATWSNRGDWVEVRGELESATPMDVPVTLGLVVPVGVESVEWLVDLHRREPVAGEQEKALTTLTPAGSRAAMSRYPFGGIAVQGHSLGIGLPIDEPRIHRIRWDGKHRALVAEVDVAISPRPQKLKGRVPFRFAIFDAEGEFGFRGLAQRYYRLNAPAYRKRVAVEGQWMPFTQLDKVERVEDFGFAFHEYHPDVSVAWDNQHGVLPLVYCEPPVQYVELGDDFPRTTTKLEEHLASLDTVQGSAVRSSAAVGADGALLVEWVKTPWAKGARIPTNCDPEIRRTEQNPQNAFDINWEAFAKLLRRRASDSPVDWAGGQIVDGVVGCRGRALYLAKGEVTSQKFSSPQDAQATGTLRLKLRSRLKGRLGVTFGLEGGLAKSLELGVGPKWTTEQVALPQGRIERLRLECRDGEIWIDSLEADGLAVRNGDFERGSSDLEMPAGLYMDSFEGWDSYKLNFRPEHLELSDAPLTFDAETGRCAQVIMFHNFEFAAEVARRLYARGPFVLMANTALYQWPWSAGLLDILGIETSWVNSARLETLDYLRTMLYQKPYCFLLNVPFASFRGEKVREYFATCFHYGFWPGFFSPDAANHPYWEDATLYNEDRPLFLKYMRVQRRTTAAGWEPITLASCATPKVLVERWGGGPYEGGTVAPETFYLTVFNQSATTTTAQLNVDERLVGRHRYLVLEALSGQMVAAGTVEQIDVAVGAREAACLYFVRREAGALEKASAAARQELIDLVRKYVSYGYTAESRAARLQRWLADESSGGAAARQELGRLVAELPPLYGVELGRAFSEWSLLAAAREELVRGLDYAPRYPKSAVPGLPYEIHIDRPRDLADRLGVEWMVSGVRGHQEFTGTSFSIPIPQQVEPGSFLSWRLYSLSPETLAPYYVASVPILPAVALSGLPAQLVVGGGQTPLEVFLVNNANRPQNLEISVADKAGLLKEQRPMTVTVPPHHSKLVRLTMAPLVATTEDRRTALVVRVKGELGEVATQVPTTVLGENASRLRPSDVMVEVDSCYLGYSERPLNDGVVETKGLDWSEAAWASDEGRVPHWAEFRFGEPTQLHEVTLYWAWDDGRYWTSRRVEVQVQRSGTATWETVAVVRNESETSMSRVRFSPVRVEALRIYQAGGDGPPRRSGILWLREVEAR